MTWVLLAITLLGTPSVTAVRFETYDGCMAAARFLNRSASLLATCVSDRKGALSPVAEK